MTRLSYEPSRHADASTPMAGDEDSATPGRPEARPDVVFRKMADVWVLYDGAASKLHALNLTSALVWTFCRGDRTVEEIASAVWSAFADPPAKEAVHTHVLDAVRSFQREGLLR